MDKKLSELIDRQEIHQVLLRYGRGLDRLDTELTRSCYWDDAIDDHAVFVGSPDDFIAWANGTTLHFRSTQHALMNHWCELDGDDAYTETYYLFIGVAEKPPHLMTTGRYVDHFQRRNGDWRIANRVITIDGAFGLEDNAVSSLPSPYAPGENPATRDRNDVSYHRPPKPRRPPES